MLYRSTLGLFKESAEEGKKLMKGCQASYMEPPESPREEGTEQWLQVVFFLFSFSLGFFFFCSNLGISTPVLILPVAVLVLSAPSFPLSKAPKILRVVTKEEEGENQFMCIPP